MSNSTSTNRSNIAHSSTAARITKEYVAKDREKVTVEFLGKQVEIRRVWDQKKQELKTTILEHENNPELSRVARDLVIAQACIKAVGIKEADRKAKEVGEVVWTEGEYECTSPKYTIKYYKSGGQIRVERCDDGSQKLLMDKVTLATVKQCIKDAKDWSEEDQSALEEYQRIRKIRKEAALRHELFERENVSEFSLSQAFDGTGL